MTRNDMNPVTEAFRNPEPLLDALRRAAQAALWRHKCLGRPVCGLKDGRVVWIPAVDIAVTRVPEHSSVDTTR